MEVVQLVEVQALECHLARELPQVKQMLVQELTQLVTQETLLP